MTSPPHRDRVSAKQETRDALVMAGLAEFAERGLDAPSLDAICARAGFTRGAFYVHFRNREDFLESVMERVFGSFLDAIIATGDGPTDLQHTIERFAVAAALAPDRGARLPALAIDIHRVLDACARSPLLKKRFVELITAGSARVAAVVQSGQEAGSVRADVDPHVLGSMLALLAFGVLTALDTGVPVEIAPLRDIVLRLLSPDSH